MSAGSGWLAAPEDAWLYERYEVHVVGLPQDAANVTVRVEGGSGLVEYRVFGQNRWANATFEVTEAWGSGGTVFLAWDNATGAFEEQVAFRVACSSVCISSLITRAVGKAAGNYIALTAALVFLALFAIGHGAAVYAKRNGQAPWTESLALAARSKVSRDPMYRTKADPLGILPAAMRAEWADFAAATRELANVQVAAKRFLSKNWRLARKISGVRKAAEKGGLLKETPPAMPVSSMKPPEETVKQAIPETPAPAAPATKPKRAPKVGRTAAEVVKDFEGDHPIKIVRSAPKRRR